MARRLLVALAVALWAVALNAGAVSADSSIRETANTTYELVPAKGVIQVTLDLRVENHVPSTTTYVACTKYTYDLHLGWLPYSTTCPSTTDYYVNGTVVWTEAGASNLVVTADSGSVTRSVYKKQTGYVLWKLGFKNVYNGQARRLHITYSIAGGKPRTPTSTRAGAAYAQFCAAGNGPDGGTVTVVLPGTFASSTSGGAATQESSGGKTIYRSGDLSDPINYYLCVEGTNESAYRRTGLATADGHVITIESWPEDATWLAAVKDEAGTSMTALEGLIGRGIPETGALTIREIAAAQLGDYAGTFDSETLVATVSESVEPGTVAHELSHAWFNSGLFEDRWLNEGSAGWAERAATQGSSSCVAPGAYPGTGSPDLNTWQFLGPKATDTEWAVLGYEYDAACYIVTAAATAMGPDRVRDVLAYLMDRKVPYLAGEPDRLPARSLTWQTWLDVVDEVGLVPTAADLDATQQLLASYGVATDAEQLGLRSQARQAYHEFAASLPLWQVPAFVRRSLADWRFSDAIAALEAGSELRAAAIQTDATLPEAGATIGTDETAFEQVTSLPDLKTAVSDAQALKRAADLVATSLAASKRQGGVLDQIGLIGTDLDPLRKSAVAAVQAGDSARAESQAAQLTDELNQASSNGTVRVGGAALATVAFGAAGFLLLRRRRRRIAAPGGGTAEDAILGASEEPIETPAVPPMSGAPAHANTSDEEAIAPWHEGVDEGLRSLGRQHSEGLLTDEEYAAKRSEIIGRI